MSHHTFFSSFLCCLQKVLHRTISRPSILHKKISEPVCLSNPSQFQHWRSLQRVHFAVSLFDISCAFAFLTQPHFMLATQQNSIFGSQCLNKLAPTLSLFILFKFNFMHQKTLLLYITKNTFILYYGACNDTFSLLGKHVLTFPNLLSKVRRYMLKDSEFRVMLWKLLAKKIQPFLYFMYHVAVAACPQNQVSRVRCLQGLATLRYIACMLSVVRCKMC